MHRSCHCRKQLSSAVNKSCCSCLSNWNSAHSFQNNHFLLLLSHYFLAMSEPQHEDDQYPDTWGESYQDFSNLYVPATQGSYPMQMHTSNLNAYAAMSKHSSSSPERGHPVHHQMVNDQYVTGARNSEASSSPGRHSPTDPDLQELAQGHLQHGIPTASHQRDTVHPRRRKK